MPLPTWTRHLTSYTVSYEFPYPPMKIAVKFQSGLPVRLILSQHITNSNQHFYSSPFINQFKVFSQALFSGVGRKAWASIYKRYRLCPWSGVRNTSVSNSCPSADLPLPQGRAGLRSSTRSQARRRLLRRRWQRGGRRGSISRRYLPGTHRPAYDASQAHIDQHFFWKESIVVKVNIFKALNCFAVLQEC